MPSTADPNVGVASHPSSLHVRGSTSPPSSSSSGHVRPRPCRRRRGRRRDGRRAAPPPAAPAAPASARLRPLKGGEGRRQLARHVGARATRRAARAHQHRRRRVVAHWRAVLGAVGKDAQRLRKLGLREVSALRSADDVAREALDVRGRDETTRRASQRCATRTTTRAASRRATSSRRRRRRRARASSPRAAPRRAAAARRRAPFPVPILDYLTSRAR